MKLETQVPSLQLCKRLKELGWDQPTLFSWIKRITSTDLALSRDAISHQITYPAPTVAELGEALKDAKGDYYSKYKYGKAECGFQNSEQQRFIEADTEANARAKMVIYLLENNLLVTR
jgi:hypothetical protein